MWNGASLPQSDLEFWNEFDIGHLIMVVHGIGESMFAKGASMCINVFLCAEVRCR